MKSKRNLVIGLISLCLLICTIELVGIHCALGHVTGVYFNKSDFFITSDFCTNYPVTKMYLVNLFVKKTIIFKTKNSFAFPTKSLRASSVAFINPPFCRDTFFTNTR